RVLRPIGLPAAARRLLGRLTWRSDPDGLDGEAVTSMGAGGGLRRENWDEADRVVGMLAGGAHDVRYLNPQQKVKDTGGAHDFFSQSKWMGSMGSRQTHRCIRLFAQH